MRKFNYKDLNLAGGHGPQVAETEVSGVRKKQQLEGISLGKELRGINSGKFEKISGFGIRKI